MQLLFTDPLAYGPVDGHDEREQEAAPMRAALRAPVIVHVVTRKGIPAGRGRPGRADAFHGPDRSGHRTSHQGGRAQADGDLP